MRWMEVVNWLTCGPNWWGGNVFPDPTEDGTDKLAGVRTSRRPTAAAAAAALIEDVVQLLCTFFIELSAKPEAMVGCAGSGTAPRRCCRCARASERAVQADRWGPAVQEGQLGGLAESTSPPARGAARDCAFGVAAD